MSRTLVQCIVKATQEHIIVTRPSDVPVFMPLEAGEWDDEMNEKSYKGEDLDFSPQYENERFIEQFTMNAAKDILCAIIKVQGTDEMGVSHQEQIDTAIEYATSLVGALKDAGELDILL